MKKFGWAVIGSGYIAKRVSNEITQNGKHKIVSIYSRNCGEALKLTEKCGGDACSDFETAVNRDDVDGVYVGTPHSSHYEYIYKSLELGKNVLCEKPVVVNLNQLESAFEKADEKNLYMSEIMSFRFNPAYIKARKIIKSGMLGDIKKIVADIGFDASLLPKRKRLMLPECAGGALLDLGIYPISLIEDLLGYTENIKSTCEFLENGVDGTDKIKLSYGKTVCNVECSMQKVTSGKAFIYCENGLVRLPGFFKPSRVFIEQNGETSEIDAPYSYCYQFDRTIDEIRKGMKRSVNNPESSIRNNMKMLDIIRGQIGLRYSDDVEKIYKMRCVK